MTDLTVGQLREMLAQFPQDAFVTPFVDHRVVREIVKSGHLPPNYIGSGAAVLKLQSNGQCVDLIIGNQPVANCPECGCECVGEGTWPELALPDTCPECNAPLDETP